MFLETEEKNKLGFHLNYLTVYQWFVVLGGGFRVFC